MSSQRLAILLCAVILAIDVTFITLNALMNAGVAMPMEVIEAQLNLKYEGNLAVWYSSVQLALMAMAAMTIGALVSPVRGSRSLHRLIWLSIALVSLWLSADETAQLHEWLSQRYADYAGENDRLSQTLGITDIYRWLIVLAPAAILGIAALAIAACAMRRTSRLACGLGVAGLACWVSALLAEYFENRLFAITQHRYPRWRGQLTTVEEGGELLGAGLLLTAFMICLLYGMRPDKSQSIQPAS